MASITISTPSDFDLPRDVCSYGYFVLAPNYWDVRGKTLWRVLSLDSGAALVGVRQTRSGAPLRVEISRAISALERAQVVQQLTRMLRLDEPAASLAEFHRLDPRFAKTGRGRLFRSPTLFEDVIKTVTSCNVQWPSTVHMNKRLCEVLGQRVALPARPSARSKAHQPATLPDVHAFPDAQRVARARPETLRSRCRVGYRDVRIVELAKIFTKSPKRGGLDQGWFESPATSDDEVFDALVKLPGIGPYAAANIMQLLGRYARLPLDTESVRHGKAMLGMKGSSAKIMKQVKAHFAPFINHAFRSYWFEIWNFYESKHGPAWTWERSTTGTMFTAALLNKSAPTRVP
jgi:3-methyladenine DNA glycosylase/8-oxoguanine DNA glycosylase